MIDQARRRLLVALGASVLLHVWVVQTGEPGARRADAAGAPLVATLGTVPHLPVQAFEPGEAPVPDAPLASRESIATTESRRVALTAPAPLAPDDHSVAQTATRSSGESTAVPASDPTYYTARNLDVYPRALSALDLGLQPGEKVRATVLIDESGTVNEVRAIEADAAGIEHAARDLLLRTRFTPASKDGRVVKAQLLVSLDSASDPGRR